MTILQKRGNYKGENGRVLTIGGSTDLIGAPALTALAALRTGIDLSVIAAPEKVAYTINSYSPDLITKKFLGEEFNLSHCKEIILLSETFDVIILGNGLGIKKDFVLKLLRSVKKPMVIDADAIKVISLDVVSKCILTPHAKEFQILYNNTIKKPGFDELDMEANIKVVQKQLADNVVLLKGPTDIIFSNHRRYMNKSGHNSMTVAGTGDVLAGICAGYFAQTGKLFESAKHAAQINGKLGEQMYKQKGYSYTAYDMVNELWRVVK